MRNDVCEVLADQWEISTRAVEAAGAHSPSICRRLDRLPEDAGDIDLEKLHADTKLVLMDEEVS